MYEKRFSAAKIFVAFLMAISIIACVAVCTSVANAANANEGEPVRVLCLSGPTGIGLSKLMEDAAAGLTENKYEFTIATAVDGVMADVIQERADIVALPSNMAAILWNRLEGDVRLLAVNTLSVLSVLERGDGIKEIKDLRGKTIVASGRGAAPEYVFMWLLRENGIDPERDCVIDWKSEHSEVLAALAAGKGDVALLPHPFVEAALAKVEGLKIALDLGDAWRDSVRGGANEGSEIVMGVDIARAGYVKSHEKEVAVFLREAAASAEYVNAHPVEAGELVAKYNILPNAKVAASAIPHCGIVLIPGGAGSAMKDAVSGYLKVLFDANPKSVGGALPSDDFYYAPVSN